MSAARYRATLTVVTVGGEEHRHVFHYATEEMANAESNRILADFMANAGGGGGLLMVGNPSTVYVVDNVLFIRSEAVVEV